MNRAQAAALTILAGALSCTRTETIRFAITTGAPGCPACSIDLSCMTHVEIRYDRADAPRDIAEPPLFSECRPLTARSGTTLCGFGPELGQLPSLPQSEAFRISLAGFHDTPATPGACHADDRIFQGATTTVDLGGRGRPPATISLDVDQCAPCSAVTGRVLDFMDRTLVRSGQVRFGLVTVDAQFIPTSNTGDITADGEFAVVSDETLYRNAASRTYCRAYEVLRDNYSSLYCHPGDDPRLPLHQVEALAIKGNLARSLDSLFVGYVQGSLIGAHGLVVGRVLTEDTVTPELRPVESAVVTAPGKCDDPSPGSGVDPTDKGRAACLWYLTPDLNGFTADHAQGTSDAGVFLSTFRRGIGSVSHKFSARATAFPVRAPDGRANFVPGHVFLVELRDRFGTR